MTTEEIKEAARSAGVQDWFFESIEDFVSDYTLKEIIDDWNMLKRVFPGDPDFA